ncbi:MAG: patatin family protein [Lachnospiraceae bacterium]|nr:patatin family protein [Lachnospiraceae bacterium]
MTAMRQEKTGLVLEGGGMRGIFTAGVLDVFMEEGITFDGVIGVSAGAVHGSSFVSGQHGRSIRYYKKYCNDKRFMSYWNLIRTGDVAGVQFCYHELPDIWDPYDYEAFRNAHTEFYVTCTNVESGKAEYLRICDMKKQVDLMRASASLPYVSRIVVKQGLKLLDGGLADSIPVLAFREMGFRKTVVVLTRQKGYIKPPEKTRLARVMYHKYPEFIETIRRRNQVYNKTLRRIEELEAAGEIFVIRPDAPPEMGRIERDPEKLQQLYDRGRRDALRRLPDLKLWLGK